MCSYLIAFGIVFFEYCVNLSSTRDCYQMQLLAVKCFSLFFNEFIESLAIVLQSTNNKWNFEKC